jgi:hypothetical protein
MIIEIHQNEYSALEVRVAKVEYISPAVCGGGLLEQCFLHHHHGNSDTIA